MKINTWIRAQRSIRKVARTNGITTLQCRRDMQEAIDAAWATQDPDAKAAQLRLFPSGQKPTVEEFMVVLAGKLDGPKP